LCTPTAKIIKIVFPYPTTSKEELTKPNQKPLLQTEFTLEEFCQRFDLWTQLLPDGVMSTFSHRSIHEITNGRIASRHPAHLFLSCFDYSGCLLSKEIDIVKDNLEDITDLEALLGRSCINRELDFFQTMGSLLTHVNKDGKIEKIEFFFVDRVINSV
jgi:hypothetical protein